jgi:hypothetical protein
VKHITQQMVAPIIQRFRVPFDTHELERLTLRRHTEAFARELLEYRQCRDPLLQFSAQFGRWVLFTFRHELQKATRVESENLGGSVCENQQWRRR